MHLVQAQNVHATVELAACRSGRFNTTFLPNRSDKRQRSGQIKAVGCWFESGHCVGALRYTGGKEGMELDIKKKWNKTCSTSR